MRTKLSCGECSLNIKGLITEAGCPRCGSMDIKKHEYYTNKDWITWWFNTALPEWRKTKKKMGLTY